ncbi:ABC transporter permease subunit [Gracilibacillus salitolerans]|uniref:ABC transporter permease subunit n=1 Tax=Gracilibacillus salitolerans TaxID=2663022 RepID=A0A5Q2TMR3_9BACI|nr:sugar ABC transporter permease [Gracilibacillus salitolerans]QGH36244.1 ABC transporter permease subunit [Gracilibacillus salitolerans]
MKVNRHLSDQNINIWKQRLLPWILLSPTILILSLVVGAPIIGTIALAFTDWNGIADPNFIGFDNFIRLFQDDIFYTALLKNFKWLVFFLTIPVFFGLIIAVFISRIQFGKTFYRMVIFLPYIIATVVTAKIWLWLYNPFVGINTFFEDVGLEQFALSWLGNSDIVLYAVALADGWHFVGFLVVLFLVGLQQTDQTLEEAAKVEGANQFRIFWHVVLPQLRPTVRINLYATHHLVLCCL